MKVAFYTFGCKLNQCETEALASYYQSQGFFIESVNKAADLYIINTCTVTSKSEQKARRIIRNIALANPRALVAVTGCYAQLAKESISGLAGNVFVVTQAEKAKLFAFADSLKCKDNFEPNTQQPGIVSLKAAFSRQQDTGKPGIPHEKPEPAPFRFKVDKYQFHSRAFCKIQDGCNNGCAYCRVPLARGKSISLDPETVLHRIKELEQSGYREIVLTGVNICSYSYLDYNLVKLLKNILSSLSRARVRLSSLEPDMITPELGAVLAHKTVCPHFHIPVQSGSDLILGRMHRHYNAEQVIRAVELLNSVKPAAFISGDMIVGFPGETEADFQLTRTLMARLNFSGLHVFPFSPRPGTAAYTYKDKIPERIKKERSIILKNLIAANFQSYLVAFKGKKLEILLEKKISADNDKPIIWQGLSGNYLKIEIIQKDMPFARGMLVEGEVTEPGAVSRAEYLSIL